jgi:hypothetical protein
MSSDGGVKVGVMVLELRRAEGVVVELEASSAAVVLAAAPAQGGGRVQEEEKLGRDRGAWPCSARARALLCPCSGKTERARRGTE